METLFLIGQIVLGVYFILSGVKHFMHLEMLTGYAASKKMPTPKFAIVVTGIMMLFGGLGVLFQFELVWSYGLLIAFLVLAAFMMHPYWKDSDASTKMSNRINFEKNLGLAAALLMLLVLQG